ncbi:MAG: hypothetical protein MAGBODY4_01134 [Candidatus Marinimicrobia bacterium]|nr:hypothetical protein [Candidatus Neomarinimicrobiota bacterium]
MTDNTQSAAPTVETLSEMIEYQEGAVVSRTLIKKNTGTLTLFAFDKGEGLSEHTSPYEALVHVIDGTAMVTISGKEYTVKAGEVLTLPAEEPHGLKAEQRFKMLLTMVRA